MEVGCMSYNWSSGDLLPNVQEVEIDPQKFADYSMNPDNPRNRGKWKAFAALGYNVESVEGRKIGAEDIIRQVRKGVIDTPATESQASIYGQRFQVRVRIRGFNGREGTLATS